MKLFGSEIKPCVHGCFTRIPLFFVQYIFSNVGISQYFTRVASHALLQRSYEMKIEKIIELLSCIDFKQCLIFANQQQRWVWFRIYFLNSFMSSKLLTLFRAQSVSNVLTHRGFPSSFISAGLEQQQRLAALKQLQKYECRILVSTDLVKTQTW